MGTTSTTRSIEIDAPVEKVFAVLADPEKAVLAFPMGDRVIVSDITTSSEGTLRSYRETIVDRADPRDDRRTLGKWHTAHVHRNGFHSGPAAGQAEGVWMAGATKGPMLATRAFEFIHTS